MDYCDPIAEFFRLAHDVCRKDNRPSVIPEFADGVLYFNRVQYVEATRGLVENNDARVMGDSPSDGDFLLHAG